MLYEGKSYNSIPTKIRQKPMATYNIRLKVGNLADTVLHTAPIGEHNVCPIKRSRKSDRLIRKAGRPPWLNSPRQIGLLPPSSQRHHTWLLDHETERALFPSQETLLKRLS